MLIITPNRVLHVNVKLWMPFICTTAFKMNIFTVGLLSIENRTWFSVLGTIASHFIVCLFVLCSTFPGWREVRMFMLNSTGNSQMAGTLDCFLFLPISSTTTISTLICTCAIQCQKKILNAWPDVMFHSLVSSALQSICFFFLLFFFLTHHLLEENYWTLHLFLDPDLDSTDELISLAVTILMAFGLSC